MRGLEGLRRDAFSLNCSLFPILYSQNAFLQYTLTLREGALQVLFCTVNV